jgi:hypothetical protein
VNEISIADGLRILALLQVPVIEASLIVVFRFYFLRYRSARAAGMVGRRSKDASHWIGLLPLHVILVSAGTALLVLAEASEMIQRFGEPLVWTGAPLALVAYSLLTAALFVLARYEHRLYVGRGR